jgi:prepilin-type N-terminal cleavage/methylation domain-containing protein
LKVTRKRAFTLIELLVVIAIIAILAAILFPVFAAAKLAAKKTQTLAQFKQTGLSTNIYITDSDDVFPLAMSFDSLANHWRYSGATAVTAIPAGWTSTGGRDTFPRIEEDRSVIWNSIQPYTKSYAVYEASGLGITNHWNFVQSNANGAPQPAKVNLTYNGLLHSWSATAVNQPSKLPMMLENYKENTLGGMLALPQLCCSDPGSNCRFNPGGYPQSGQTQCAAGSGRGDVWLASTDPGNFTIWVYNHTMCFVATDTSAKAITMNAPDWPLYAQNVNSSPWSSFDPTGVAGSPKWLSLCVAPGGVKPNPIYYAGYFRPDSQYDYTLTQCDFGGG